MTLGADFSYAIYRTHLDGKGLDRADQPQRAKADA